MVRYYGEEISFLRTKLGSIEPGECELIHVLPVDLNFYKQTKKHFTPTLEETYLYELKYKVVSKEELLNNYDLCLLNPPHECYGEWFETIYSCSRQIAAILPTGVITDISENKKNRKSVFREAINTHGCNIETYENNKWIFENKIMPSVSAMFLKKGNQNEIVVNGQVFSEYDEITVVPKSLVPIIEKLKINEKDSVYGKGLYKSLTKATAKLGDVVDMKHGFGVRAPERITDMLDMDRNMRIRMHNGEKEEFKEFSIHRDSVVFEITDDISSYPKGTTHYIWFETKEEANNFVEFLRCDYTRLVCMWHNRNGHNINVYKNLFCFDFTKPVTDIEIFKMFGLTFEEIRTIYNEVENIYGIDRNYVIDEFGKRKGKTRKKEKAPHD